MSFVKFVEMLLISSAIPFALSDNFFRRPLHMENNACTILCRVSKFLAAFMDLRFILSCKKLESRA